MSDIAKKVCSLHGPKYTWTFFLTGQKDALDNEFLLHQKKIIKDQNNLVLNAYALPHMVVILTGHAQICYMYHSKPKAVLYV